MDSRQLIAMIMKNGWVLINARGSHYQFRHPENRDVSRFPIQKGICQREQCTASLNKQACDSPVFS